MGKRDPVFDIAKGIGVLLVIVGHLSLQYWFINLIYFFHMPLFVFISGYFHKEKTINAILKNGLKLSGSYLLYGAFYISLSWILKGKFDLTLIKYFLLAKPTSIWAIPFFGIFWFITVTAVIKTLAGLIPINKYSLLVSVFIFFLIWYVNKYVGSVNDLPFALGQVGVLFVFYISGAQLKQYFNFLWTRRWIIYFAFLFIAVYSILFYNGTEEKIINYHQLRFFNPLIALILSLLGSFSLVFAIKELFKKTNRVIIFFKEMGEYSFVYFALHLFCFFLISSLLRHLGISNPLVLNIGLIVLTLFMCRITIYLLLRINRIKAGLTNILLLK